MATRTASERSPNGRALDTRELKKFPGYLLARARYLAFKTFEQAVRESCELRPVEFSILLLISTHENATQSQLAQALGVAAPNMTGMLRRLQERKLVERERSVTDARQQHLALTPEGRRVFDTAYAQARNADRSWMNRLSKAEQGIFLELLDKLTAT
jgi:DNA-binding MarR family transcriptional regulator